MKSVAIIGAGISGLSIAQLLKEKFKITVFESTEKQGGLIKCDRINGNLYHVVGGHVFNSNNNEVLDWFWSFFNREREFIKTKRNAVVYLNRPVGYPIENHIYELDEDFVKKIIHDLITAKSNEKEFKNFEDFLYHRFGKTLYELYFKPYNSKIWKRDLTKIPMGWLKGKLPMPTVEQILYDNIKREKEQNMVHSSFYYAKNNGSQFIADRLAEGIKINCNVPITNIQRNITDDGWILNEKYDCDFVIYTGNIKNLTKILLSNNIPNTYYKEIEDLEYHGTTTVLCEIDNNPYSWIYLPDKSYNAHRIICTGNFSDTNNAAGKISATIEFTDYISKEEILNDLTKLPFNPKYIDHRFTEFTYPIQNSDTRELIKNIKVDIKPKNFFLLGRFAEWEYYNMDKCIESAMQLSHQIIEYDN